MNHHSIKLRSLGLLIGCLVLSPQSYATPAEFKQAYASYHEAVENNDTKQAAQYALQAYEFGKKVYGESTIDTANLSFNLALALDSNKQAQESEPYFENTIDLYKTHYGNEATELVDPLLSYAAATKNDKLAKDLFLDAQDIAEDAKQPILYAHTLSATFNRLVNTRYDSNRVRRDMLKALEIYQQHLPENSITLVNARFESANILLASKKYDQAESELLEVVKQYQALEYTHPFELVSHAKLVDIYSKKDKPDLATQHCLAIGSMQPWSAEQQQTPIYRVNPMYPRSKAKKGIEGSVILSFIVNEQGFVTEPQIESSKGGTTFETESLKVLKRWRYAPKFEDGKPVKAETRVRLDFTLS